MLTNLGVLKFDHNICHETVCGLTMEEVGKLICFAVNGKHRLNRVIEDNVVKIYDECNRLVLAHLA